ncbi:MAG: hypothetical protein INR69_19740 [Mucilaginibacter polytrichastri]|nr:hypothetical protein [Mucilaginibacter polytrichastri]
MRTLFFFIAAMAAAIVAPAQDADPLKKGQQVYVEMNSANENALEVKNTFTDGLKDWGYWTVVDDKSKAGLVIVLQAQASKGITATSWGGTSVAGNMLLLAGDKTIWESDTFKSSPNGTNGFNSKKTVAKKMLRAVQKKVGK